MQNNRSLDEHMVLLEKIKAQVRCFNNPLDIQRYEELVRLKDYLNFRIRTREYEAIVAAANVNVAELRNQFVQKKLNKFDIMEKNRAEYQQWGWSPLYHIFKEWPLPNFRTSPWVHTQEEWIEIEKKLLENASTEPLSLECECPHIVRVFLVLVRTLHGYTRPLPHPTMGLTLQYILNFMMDNEKSVAFTNVVHSLATIGWAWFPGIHTVVDNFSNLHLDTIALLGYDPEKQVRVVNKIRTFIGRIAHRAITDMVRMQRSSELEDMWFAVDVPEQRRAKCEEVRHCPPSLISSLSCHSTHEVVWRVVIQLSFICVYLIFVRIFHLSFRFYVLQWSFVKTWTLDRL